MADMQEIKKIALAQRTGFMKNTVALSEDQLLDQIQTLGECKAEDESRAGQIVTQGCMDFVMAVGAFKFPSTWADAVHARFQGKG